MVGSTKKEREKEMATAETGVPPIVGRVEGEDVGGKKV